jgi:hypothetical protein
MRTLLLLLICALAIPVFGQKRDTTVIKRNGKKIQVIILDEEEMEDDMEEMEKDMEEMEEEMEEMEDEFDFEWDDDDEDDELETVKTRWGMLDIGFSTYLYNGDKKLIEHDGDMINPMKQQLWPSFNVNLQIFRQKVSLINNYVNLMYGFGFNYHQYEFDNNVLIQEETRQVMFDVDPVDRRGRPISLDKNRLRTWYITIPVMLNFETNPKDSDKSFRLSAGGFGGLRISGNLKTEYDISSTETETIKKDDFNLNQFRYGLRGEIGYGWINLYGSYALNGMFDEDGDGGYDVAPLNVGIQVIPF